MKRGANRSAERYIVVPGVARSRPPAWHVLLLLLAVAAFAFTMWWLLTGRADG